MKNLSLFIALVLLVSCTSNTITPPNINASAIPGSGVPVSSISASPVSNQTNENNFNYLQLTKELENKIGDQGINGISADILGNVYIILSYGKSIIKINKDRNFIDYRENNEVYINSTPNMFFHIDSKGNGYLIPDTYVISTIIQDPVTMKFKAFQKNKFPIYKISNLKITDTYIITIEDSRFKSYCLSQDDCSDLYLNVGGKNYSLNEFLKSKKEYIANDDLRSNIFSGANEAFNSSGSGFYLKGFNNKVYIYSFIDGISRKTDISLALSNDYYLNGKLDPLGNGYLIYIQNGKSTYHQIMNYNIGQAKDLDVNTGNPIGYSVYTAINEAGTGLIVYSDNNSYNFSKISNFKIEDQKEFLSDVKDIYSTKNATIIDKDGNGYITFNKFDGLDPQSSRSKFKTKIFAVRNYNLIK